jgi:dTDP-4-amino-4,6-dideoxygalactose transaminase
LRPDQFPNAVLAEDTTITLPIVPYMRPADQDRVAQVVRRAMKA